MSFVIDNVCISVEEKEIVRNLSLNVPKGEVHVIMGPNGSGKSTLANALMGHPKYAVDQGKIELDQKDITNDDTAEKAKAGLFLSMQYLPEIEGVTVASFLRTAKQALTGKTKNPITFFKDLQEKIKELHIDPSFAERSLHVGFSGGEKKKMEVLQLLTLQPTYAILDETDSGLDVDALKIVADGINTFRSPETGVLLITHYTRILEHVRPDKVHIMMNGQIVHSGGPELAEKIEKEGYAEYT